MSSKKPPDAAKKLPYSVNSALAQGLRQGLVGRKKGDFARQVGITGSMLSRYLKGEAGGPLPSCETLACMQFFASVSVDRLLAPPKSDDIPVLGRTTGGALAREKRSPKKKPDHVGRFQSGPFLVELKAWRVAEDPFEEEDQ